MNPNKFNDWIYCFYKDESGEQKFHCWPAATDPGLYYLRFPFQPEADQPLAEYKKGLLFLHRDNILDAGG